MKNMRNMDKPLLRAKSELPQNNETIQALIDTRVPMNISKQQSMKISVKYLREEKNKQIDVIDLTKKKQKQTNKQT